MRFLSWKSMQYCAQSEQPQLFSAATWRLQLYRCKFHRNFKDQSV